MTHYKDIFIDFDDTLYDTRGNAQIALRELWSAFHLCNHFDTIDDFTTPYWEANLDLWTRYSRGEIDRDTLIVERFRRPLSHGKGLNLTREFCLEVSDVFLDLCSSKPGLLDGARELLEYLHPRYRLHLCSNGFHEVQYKKLRASDTERYFATVILSEDAGANKPSHVFYDYALAKTGARRETTVMIGDNYTGDILGARNAGLDTIYFNRWDWTQDSALPQSPEVKQLTEIITIL